MFKYGNYKIKFMHDISPNGAERDTEIAKSIAATPCAGMTICTIVECWPNMDNSTVEVEVAQGTAYCSVKDQFDRSKGRELSFARAIKSMVPKNERLSWWKAFWKSTDGRGTKSASNYVLHQLMLRF